MQSISVLPDITKLLISGEKILISAKLKACVTSFIFVLDLLLVRFNCAKSHHCRICVREFRDGGLFALSPFVSSPKKAHPKMKVHAIRVVPTFQEILIL